MNLYRLAAIATIVATIIAAWQFIERRRNESSAINKLLSKEKAAIDLSLDLPVYKGERNWLLAMYQAALSMPYASSKSDALKKVVKASIQSNDFNMAIIAAKESPYAQTKAEMLDEIVNAAIQSKETIGYAVIAADNMPYSSSKSLALEKIINAYELFLKKQPQGEKNLKSQLTNKSSRPLRSAADFAR